jgi:hypothetical protein
MNVLDFQRVPDMEGTDRDPKMQLSASERFRQGPLLAADSGRATTLWLDARSALQLLRDLGDLFPGLGQSQLRRRIDGVERCQQSFDLLLLEDGRRGDHLLGSLFELLHKWARVHLV